MTVIIGQNLQLALITDYTETFVPVQAMKCELSHGSGGFNTWHLLSGRKRNTQLGENPGDILSYKNCMDKELQESFTLLDNVLWFVSSLRRVLYVTYKLEFKLYHIHMWNNVGFKENRVLSHINCLMPHKQSSLMLVMACINACDPSSFLKHWWGNSLSCLWNWKGN